MKLYSQNEHYKLYNGNMLDLLEVIDKESIDAVLTDPPYELNFMSKNWDNSGIAFQKETWEKCYEALKPGGYLLAFGGSRTFHRIACAIEDAGFEIRDTICWMYGSGFPKSMDISKQIDKKGGNDYSKKFAIDLKQARESRNLTMKYCDDKYCNGSTNWSWYEGRKDGCRVPDYQTYLEIIKDFPELEEYKELIKEAEREIIGTKKGVGCFNNDEHYTVGGTKANDIDITIPSTNLAKQWQGWGTALKPSFEPIIVARKPFKGSLVDNVIEYGVGGLNIDECRVAFVNKWDKEKNNKSIESYRNVKTKCNDSWKNSSPLEFANPQNENNRFPANTILTYDETDFDEVCGGFPNTKTGSIKPHKNNANAIVNKMTSENITSSFNGDSGSASRYFYCAKASKKDRDEGLEEFETTTDKAKGNGLDRVCEFCGVSQLTPELCHCETKSWITKPRKNTHPTVKPTDLMQYLIRLVTPNGGTILDPFNGSGSTGKAVMYENKERNKNYKYIGIELTEEYLPIAKARIEYVCKEKEIKEEQQKQQDKQENQMTIFDMLGDDINE